MSRFLKILVLVVASGALLSCTCANPLVVSEIQKTDKKLVCKDVILEINETEHYRDLAKSESGIGFGNFLMPICWVTSYTNASKAVKAAKVRIEYLGHIYDVMDCGGKSDNSERVGAAGVGTAPFIQIQPMMPQPPQPQQQPVMENQVLPKPTEAGQCVTEDNIKKQTHRHVDKFGKTYTHCHVNSGSHRHWDD